jgi:hypothetical protein
MINAEMYLETKRTISIQLIQDEHINRMSLLPQEEIQVFLYSE